MKVFRYLRNLVVFVVVIILAVFIYDGYHSFQGTDRESKAHTTVEKRIEQSEDTLSRTDRIIRIFTFKEKVEAALNQRVSKEHWVKGDVIPEYTKNALIAIEDKRYYKHGAIDVLGGYSRLLYQYYSRRNCRGWEYYYTTSSKKSLPFIKTHHES